jgi:DNA-binding NtrC family response regulator
VGATVARRVNVRIVAATHRNLEAMTGEGSFREDLFYRLNVIRVEVPPLRERADDIPLLVDFFLNRKSGGDFTKQKRLHPATLKRICAYPWPGNVRELQNEVERMVALSAGESVILPGALSERIRAPEAGIPARGEATLSEATERLEQELIASGLRRTRWNKSRLARELGISRTSLLQKIEKYGLERRRTPRKAA